MLFSTTLLKIASIITEKITLEHLNPLHHTCPMNESSFKNHFLIASPTLIDDTFNQAVIFLCDHSEEGAMGIIINKPLNIHLYSVLEQLNLNHDIPDVANQPVFMGGPVGQENGFVIHQPYRPEEIEDDLVISASQDVLEDITNNQGPEKYLVALGYTGWAPKQLDTEISQNDWLIAPYDKSILFDTPLANRWKAAIELLGFSPAKLSTQQGHA
jgi:putative transcriptional regulator